MAKKIARNGLFPALIIKGIIENQLILTNRYIYTLLS